MPTPEILFVLPNPNAGPIYGIVPNYAPAGTPEPPAPPPLTGLDARIAHLEALRANCLSARRTGGFTPVSTFALRELNRELDAIRAESEAQILLPYLWAKIPRPSETMLIGPAELLAALDPALANLRYLRKRRENARRFDELDALLA